MNRLAFGPLEGLGETFQNDSRHARLIIAARPGPVDSRVAATVAEPASCSRERTAVTRATVRTPRGLSVEPSARVRTFFGDAFGASPRDDGRWLFDNSPDKSRV